MNQLAASALCLLLFGVGACAKKDPRPMRTEPWLAHPPASASANSDAATPATRYTLTEQSVIRLELPTKRGPLRGSLTRITGELSIDRRDLAQSRGQVRADLGTLSVQGADGNADAALLAQARNALDLADASGASAASTFELTAFEDASPAQLESAPEGDGGAPFVRRARGTAVGDLLLHGFRVTRRASLEAEFGFGGDRQVPSTVVIRSRTPFVISLETHAIRALELEGAGKAHSGASPRAREIRVSIELYGRKFE